MSRPSPPSTFDAAGKPQVTEPDGRRRGRPAAHHRARSSTSYLVSDRAGPARRRRAAAPRSSRGVPGRADGCRANRRCPAPIAAEAARPAVQLKVKDFAPALTLEVEDGDAGTRHRPRCSDAKPIERISKRLGADAEGRHGGDPQRPRRRRTRPAQESSSTPRKSPRRSLPPSPRPAPLASAEVGKSMAKADFTTKDAKKL